MEDRKSLELQKAHEYFSVECFNRAWNYIDKPVRTPEEDEEMIRLTLVSHWHWTQRSDCTPTNLSVGYWQTSRVYALLGQADNARRYGKLCLDISVSASLLPFYVAYAYEALARAEAIAGDYEQKAHYLKKARSTAEEMVDEESKKMLLDDLMTIH